MSRSMKNIIIAGAGLTGSLLAIILGKRGYNVQVFERRPDLRRNRLSAGRSINLAISARGIRALEYAGVAEGIMAEAIPMHGRMVHLLDGQLSFQPYSTKKDEFINAIPRGDLNCKLMDAAEALEQVTIYHNKCATAFDPTTNEVTFLDEVSGRSETIKGDLVIGADGFSSVIRQGILEANGGTSEIQTMEHGYKELTIAPAMTAQIELGNDPSLYKLERNALHIWPRGTYMMIALPNPGGSFTVTLFMETAKFEALQDKAEIRRFFHQQFPDAEMILESLEVNFIENPTGNLGTLRCGPWHYQDKAVLLGDAAHAIVPFYGQGMNACFEDCVVLDEILQASGDDWAATLPEFFAVRKPNADAIAELALANYIEMRDSTGKDDFLRMKQAERRLVELFPQDFLPVYSMVSFSHLPYSFAWHCKSVQDKMLREIITRTSEPASFGKEIVSDIFHDYKSKIQEMMPRM